MNWSSWLAKVPAMKEPRNTVMTWQAQSSQSGQVLPTFIQKDS
jgi:hypothetical protein